NSMINFNGGLVKARVASAAFINGNLSNVYIRPGGLTIDDGGFALGITAPLLAPTGNGISATGGTLNAGGSGFLAAPMVEVVGGGGTGATVIANIDSSGNLTSVTITNPGVGYVSTPSFNIIGGGAGSSGFVIDNPTLVPNTSGSFTKLGSGVVTL